MNQTKIMIAVIITSYLGYTIMCVRAAIKDHRKGEGL